MKQSKKANIPKNTTEDWVLDWLKIKKNRMKFFKEVWNIWAYTDDSKSLMMFGNKSHELNNQLHRVYRALSWVLRDEDGDSYIETRHCIEVHTIYWERIGKYACKKVRSLKYLGQWPTLGRTKSLKVLLDRGYVHEEDVPEEFDYKEFHIICHIAPLVWPKSYKEQIQAISQMGKVGIPGRTGIKPIKR